MSDVREVLAEIRTARGLDATIGPAALERWDKALSEVVRAEAERWLSEEQAMRRAARKRGYFRARRTSWLADGYVRRVGRAWFYHEAVVPRSRRAASDDPREQARRDAA